jgi:NAD(P)-dependent dehydrogenase (short-subunit alcohol dehydrogenase family)
MSEFSGKVVMITGAGSGIGRGAALLFGRDGARVGIIDRHDAAVRETAELVGKEGGEALPLCADISQATEVETAVRKTVDRYGRIDVLFANAAIQIAKSTVDTTVEEWDELHGVNLRGTFLCCKHVVPVMQKQGGGSIVIVSSGHAFVTYPNCSAYAATKGGLLAFMRGVALDYAAYGIRVNCVVPGATDTPMLRNYFRDCPDPQAEEKRVLKGIPLQRFATPEDIAKAVRFLASKDASYITGVWLAVDGGLLAQG